jgi:hypothetical protein
MEQSSQKLFNNFPEKILSKLKQADDLLIKEYELFMNGKNTFTESQTKLVQYINKFFDDLKEAFESERSKHLKLINEYCSKIKQEFDKVDELLQNNKRIINKGLNYINILRNQNFIEVRLVDQLELIEQLNLNSLLDDNVNNKINLFLFKIKNNMLIPEIIVDNKIYSLVQEMRNCFNIQVNQKFFGKINLENININNILNTNNNDNNIDINNLSSIFKDKNDIYLLEENDELKNLIEDLCGIMDKIDINLIPKFIWVEPNSNNIYEIFIDKNNSIKSEIIEYKYITNGASENENNNKKDFLFNDEFRVSNLSNDLIYISGGVLSNNSNNNSNGQIILNSLYEYSLKEKTLKEKAHMKIGRINHGIILINDMLYICGGLDQNLKISNTCEKYDIKENKWINMSEMKNQISKINLAQIDEDTLVAFGGIKKDNIFNYDIHYYKIGIDTWFILDNFKLPKGIIFPGICKINDKYIIIFGGVNENGEESKDVFKMDISMGSYELLDKNLNKGGLSLYFSYFVNNNEIHMLLNHQNQKYPDRIVFNL